MSNYTNNPPVETHRDGAVSVKVWRNITKNGNPAYSVTFQRTYTDPNTNQVAESRSFGGTDILKIPQLASEAYRTIGQMREMDRAERGNNITPPHDFDQQPTRLPLDSERQNIVSQNVTTSNAVTPKQDGLAHQRDDAMNNVAPEQNKALLHVPTPER